MKGLFGNMFDFNRDGKLDAFEMAAEFQFFNDVIMSSEDSEDDDGSTSSSDEQEVVCVMFKIGFVMMQKPILFQCEKWEV